MLAAKSVALSKPVGGGASGAHMAKVFEQLGITRSDGGQGAIRRRRRGGTGRARGLRGEAEIGIQQMAELMAVAGIDVVGPLPAELQRRHRRFTARNSGRTRAIREAGRALIAFLTTPAAKSVIKAKGLDPRLRSSGCRRPSAAAPGAAAAGR